MLHLNLNDGTGVRSSTIMSEHTPPPDPVFPPHSESLSQQRVTFNSSIPFPTAPELAPFPENRSTFSKWFKGLVDHLMILVIQLHHNYS